MRRLSLSLVALAVLIALVSIGARRAPDLLPPPQKRFEESSWLQFSNRIDDRRTYAAPVTPENVADLHVDWTAKLPEIADSAALYVSNVNTAEGLRDLVIVETMTGRILAYDARDGALVWQTQPPAGPRWTTSSPAVGPRAEFVYAYCLDGRIHRYAVNDGVEATGDGWPVLVTKKGEVEKGSSNIIIATAQDGKSYLYMTIAAYPEPGDEGDYQGHLVTVDLESGQSRVFNALCSDRPVIFDGQEGAGDCSEKQAGIWARAAAVYDNVTDRIFLTTGNGAFDADRGGYNWGTSVIALRPDGSTDEGTPLDSFTPWNYQTLTDIDADLSSTTIAILPVPRRAMLPRLGVQSGKDGTIRLLNLEDLSGTGGPRAVGGSLQDIDVPQGGGVFTQPVTWYDPRADFAQVIIANHRGISAMQLIPTPEPHLETRWISSDIKGTSPVLANGLLFVAGSRAIAAFDPATGEMRWGDTSIGDIHWQSPIVVNGRLIVCDQTATLYAYTLH
jgi:hypothetical protein